MPSAWLRDVCGSAAEIAPCPLSLVLGVEFLENRFDGVRVAPCFVAASVMALLSVLL
jgi:hypothetical protein